jgi:hypothetical protein
VARRDRLIRSNLRTRFLVTLKSEDTFDGVLLDHDESNFVLADASAVSTKGDRVPVDGHLWLPRADVKYMQAATVPMPGFTA